MWKLSVLCGLKIFLVILQYECNKSNKNKLYCKNKNNAFASCL